MILDLASSIYADRSWLGLYYQYTIFGREQGQYFLMYKREQGKGRKGKYTHGS